MSSKQFNRTEISKAVGWDYREIYNPGLALIKSLEQDLDSEDEATAKSAMIRLYGFYRFMKSPESDLERTINDNICRICRERVE